VKFRDELCDYKILMKHSALLRKLFVNKSIVNCWIEQLIILLIWSLTLREEHRLRAFEDRVLRRIFGPKRDEVTGEWRKLHSEELHNLYSSPDIIRQVKSRRIR
jgi:hypothetical protein